MPQDTIRWIATKRVIDMARAHPKLDGVLVEPGWPGDKFLRPEMIWVDQITGPLSYPVSTAGRKHTADIFTIPFELRCGSRTTLDDAMSRLAEMVAALHDVIVETADLDGLDGVMSATPLEQSWSAGRPPSGEVLAFAEYPIEIESRLT